MLLLASASPARRRLLEQAALPHRVQVSGVDEEGILESDPFLLVQRLAEAKAQAVAEAVSVAQAVAGAGEGVAPADAILGCDSLFVFQGEVFGKPRDPEEAVQRWLRMAGSWGELLTGHCLIPVSPAGSQPLVATIVTRVLFAPVDRPTIEAYVSSGEPLACAGGFALEGRGGLLVERIEGCYSNVIGLSLPLLRGWLESISRD
ncbi:MAG: nucleoside triphosphate pyrophosphatase [Cyanobacteriota bacterium]